MKFELSPEQEEKFENWQDTIKIKYGIYGVYTFKFVHTGIGLWVEVENDIKGETIDLTEYDKW